MNTDFLHLTNFMISNPNYHNSSELWLIVGLIQMSHPRNLKSVSNNNLKQELIVQMQANSDEIWVELAKDIEPDLSRAWKLLPSIIDFQLLTQRFELKELVK